MGIRREAERGSFSSGLVSAALSVALGVGFGHAALGHTKRGMAWLALTLIVLALVSRSIWCLPLAVVIACAGTVDAFVLGYRKREQPTFRFIHASTIAVPIITFATLVALRAVVFDSAQVISTSMIPTLEVGDRVLISKVGAPERGDVIVFDYPCEPSRLYVHRIVATAGDTVEVRCGIAYVNGRALERTVGESADTCTYSEYDSRDRRWRTRRCIRYRETNGEDTYETAEDADVPSGEMHDFPQRAGEGPICLGTGEKRSVDPESWKMVETSAAGSVGECEQQLHYIVPAGHVFVLGDNRNSANDSRFWGPLPISAIKGRAIGIWGTRRPGEGLTVRRFGSVR